MIRLSFGPVMDHKEQRDFVEEMLEDSKNVGVYNQGGYILLDDEVNADNMVNALLNLMDMMGYGKQSILEAIIRKGRDSSVELVRLIGTDLPEDE